MLQLVKWDVFTTHLLVFIESLLTLLFKTFCAFTIPKFVVGVICHWSRLSSVSFVASSWLSCRGFTAMSLVRIYSWQGPHQGVLYQTFMFDWKFTKYLPTTMVAFIFKEQGRSKHLLWLQNFISQEKDFRFLIPTRTNAVDILKWKCWQQTRKLFCFAALLAKLIKLIRLLDK